MECLKELPMFITTLNEGIISIESELLSMVIIDRGWVYIKKTLIGNVTLLSIRALQWHYSWQIQVSVCLHLHHVYFWPVLL